MVLLHLCAKISQLFLRELKLTLQIMDFKEKKFQKTLKFIIINNEISGNIRMRTDLIETEAKFA
jgi:hypothetical protein